MKAKFTSVNRPESSSLIRSLSKHFFFYFFLADNLSVFLICNSLIAPALRTFFLPGPRICRELL